MGTGGGYVTLRLFHAEVLGKYRNSLKSFLIRTWLLKSPASDPRSIKIISSADSSTPREAKQQPSPIKRFREASMKKLIR